MSEGNNGNVTFKKYSMDQPSPLPVFTSERILYYPSFNEMMGYPGNKLATEYWFPGYDDHFMNTDLIIGTP